MNIEQLLKEILNLSDMRGLKPIPIDREDRLMEITELIKRDLKIVQQRKADSAAKHILLQWMMNQPLAEAEPFNDAWKRLSKEINVFLEKYPGD